MIYDKVEYFKNFSLNKKDLKIVLFYEVIFKKLKA